MHLKRTNLEQRIYVNSSGPMNFSHNLWSVIFIWNSHMLEKGPLFVFAKSQIISWKEIIEQEKWLARYWIQKFCTFLISCLRIWNRSKFNSLIFNVSYLVFQNLNYNENISRRPLKSQSGAILLRNSMFRHFKYRPQIRPQIDYER